ncbi:hypothetical protein [Spirosoma panaciterrae]|uniref:hypothetical protein n=1 Tax=Spirosoma panaciterrae TaxID=496058 RepID=UPI0003661059|nr:hypothetical protein [Spirosoma panaciterrae]
MNRTKLHTAIDLIIDYLSWAHQQQRAGYHVDPVKMRDAGYVLAGLTNHWLDLPKDNPSID